MRRSMWRAVVKILLSILICASIFVLAILMVRVPAAQDMTRHSMVSKPVPNIEPLAREYNIDSLLQLYGKYKELPEGYELEALIALSYYPELREVPIAFELIFSGAALEANIDLSSIFIGERKYIIYLNTSDEGFFSPVHIQNLPFDPLVAIFAHELAHFIYYEQCNAMQLGNWGLRFLFSYQYRSRHEWTTDKAVIYRGLGYQLYNYATFARNAPGIKATYELSQSFFDEMYMSPAAVMEEMEKTGNYDTSLVDKMDQ